MTEDDEFSYQDSGPYCRHWTDFGSCNATCTKCGHGCQDHEDTYPSECTIATCDCKEWKEK